MIDVNAIKLNKVIDATEPLLHTDQQYTISSQYENQNSNPNKFIN